MTATPAGSAVALSAGVGDVELEVADGSIGARESWQEARSEAAIHTPK
jgi:hypothetical protein